VYLGPIMRNQFYAYMNNYMFQRKEYALTWFY
jgi:hypothetical protein